MFNHLQIGLVIVCFDLSFMSLLGRSRRRSAVFCLKLVKLYYSPRQAAAVTELFDQLSAF